MNYAAYLVNLKEQLLSAGFVAPAPSDGLTGQLGLALEREENWGRLIIALVGKPNIVEGAEQEGLVAAASDWVCSLPVRSYLILVFPFDRRVSEAESQAILRLRQDGAEEGWAVIPWTADLEVGLLDQHAGFPPVPTGVLRALTEVPEGATGKAVQRRATPRSARPGPLLALDALPVTRTILAATIAFYLWLLLMDRMDSLFDIIGWVLGGPDLDTLIRWGANSGALVLYEGQQWRLVTHILLHGGIWHLGFNMWALWQLGQYTEHVYGSRQMLIIYLVAGVSGGIASTAFRPDLVPSVGASGAIFGLFGALIYWGWTFKDRPLNWHGLWGPVAVNLMIGFFLPFIDNYAHVGGFLGGIVAGFLVGAPGERQEWKRWLLIGVGALLVLLVLGLLPLPRMAGPLG